MKPCDALLDRLDAALSGTLPLELTEHLEGCSSCQMAIERARGMAEGGQALHSVRAPEALLNRLKSLPRLKPACEQATDLLGAALDGEIPEEQRGQLVEHMHACPACRVVWESFATLREVGSITRPSPRLRAALALPPRQRIDLRRRQKRFFDLRLATAAAYMLAALTVVLLSSPANVARASSEGMDKAAVYARAAVQNRVSSYSQRIKQSLVAGEGWVKDRAVEAWDSTRAMFGGKRANPKAQERVVEIVESGKGERP